MSPNRLDPVIVKAEALVELVNPIKALPETTQAGALIFCNPNVRVQEVAPGPGVISPLVSVAPADTTAPLPQEETTGTGWVESVEVVIAVKFPLETFTTAAIKILHDMVELVTKDPSAVTDDKFTPWVFLQSVKSAEPKFPGITAGS